MFKLTEWNSSLLFSVMCVYMHTLLYELCVHMHMEIWGKVKGLPPLLPNLQGLLPNLNLANSAGLASQLALSPSP